MLKTMWQKTGGDVLRMVVRRHLRRLADTSVVAVLTFSPLP